MQAGYDGARYQDVFGFCVMKIIKNNPKNYVRRSDIGKNKTSSEGVTVHKSAQREKSYLIAPIDHSGYINFSWLNKTKK